MSGRSATILTTSMIPVQLRGLGVRYRLSRIFRREFDADGSISDEGDRLLSLSGVDILIVLDTKIHTSPVMRQPLGVATLNLER